MQALRAGSWAMSETIGCAMNPAARGSGMMEYWKFGMLGLVERDLSSTFDSQFSMIPTFHHSIQAA